jgi:hypothetical protein
MIRALTRRFVLIPLLAVALAVGSIGISAPTVSAFTGHGCTKATCSFFTSSYGTSKYYYRRCDSGWRNLSNTYLHGFKTKTALLSAYPGRKLHKVC